MASTEFRLDEEAGHALPSAGFDALIGRSAALRRAIDHARMVAHSPRTTVLLIGETGTGKELFARGIHYAGSSSAAPFVAVNCAAIPESLLEGELFGHEKGAYTGAHARKQGLFELAGEGTLFLDEIHHMPMALQPKLLRALEARVVRPLGGHREAPVRCRIVAATNTSLEQSVARAEFRPDLFYRLNVFPVEIPPLRERRADIPHLVMFFLSRFSRKLGKQISAVAPETMQHLSAYEWPGNVRELQNVLERAVLLAPGQEIGAGDLRDLLGAAAAAAPGPEGDPTLAAAVAAAEREAIAAALAATGGNKTRAAERLGVSVRTLWYKLQHLGLEGARPPA